MSASRILALAALLVASATAAEAQVGTQSNAATVALTATKAATLTLSAVTPTASIASITDNSSANNFSAVSVTTDWNLTAGSTVNLVGWFAVPGSALTNGTSLIPSSRVEGKIGAGAFTPFNGAAVGASGVAGGSLTFFSQALGALQGNRTDQLDLRLNLVGFGTTVAGAYTGTLNLQAIVQ